MAGMDQHRSWEYLTIAESEHERLAELGAQGWELVAVGGTAEAPLLYLKRSAVSFRERVTMDQREDYRSRRDSGAASESSVAGDR